MKKRSSLMAFVIIISLIIGMFPITFTNDIHALEGTDNILSEPTATVEQMEAWANNLQKPDFAEHAQTFYDISVERGVNPVIPYAISAWQTGYFGFGGTVQADWHNPAGIRYVNEAGETVYSQFDSWAEGIAAQVDHLALLAGHEDYPLETTLDPNHNAVLHGIAATVNLLDAAFATEAGEYLNHITSKGTAIEAAVVPDEPVDPDPDPEPTPDGTPILGVSSTNIAQMRQFAEDNNANELASELAPLFIEAGIKAGVDPAIPYVHFLWHSGWGNYAGTVQPDWHNPAALRDADGNLLQFDSWELGIAAHVDHLALLAGQTGYPLADSPDPLHNEELLGTAPTVEELGDAYGDAQWTSKTLEMLPLLLATETEVIGTTPIMGPPTTTAEDMAKWAESRNADPLFIELAQEFYDVSVEVGVDPAITYTQSAKETNFFHFTGVLDASYMNPAGFKTTEGGGDYDPNAHHRFESWEQGIRGQVDHLALYAGAEGFPDPNSPDPRHFPSIYGVAPTVEELGGRWAPSPTYGNEIVVLMEQLYSVNDPDYEVGDPDGYSIINEASATVEQMQEWAISHDADPEFVELAQSFYDISVSKGVDPVITYAHAALSTRFLTFEGSILDKSFHSTANIKTSVAGPDEDPNSFQRFTDWDEGILAHVDHLGLYAGGEGYPDPNSPDPRHFASIRGTAPTVESLSGRWSPDPEYGANILAYMEEIWALAEVPTFTLGVEVRGLDNSRTTEVPVTVTDIEGTVVEGDFNDYGQWLSTEELAEGVYTVTLDAPYGSTVEINDTVATQVAVATDEENVFTIELNEENLGSLSAIYGAFRLVESINVVPIDPYVPADESTNNSTFVNPGFMDLLDLLIRAENDYGLTGAQLAIYEDGNLIKNSAYGYLNNFYNYYDDEGNFVLDHSKVLPVDERTEVNPSHLFDWASNTKMFVTTYALQQLVYEGTVVPSTGEPLSLDTRIADVFPQFVTQGNDEGWKDEMTLSQILSHTSGFADRGYHNDEFVTEEFWSHDKARTFEILMRMPLAAEPGSRYLYTDTDMMIAGFIIEELTGQDLDTYVKANIYTPLGLNRLTFNPMDNGFTAGETAAAELHGNTRDGRYIYTGVRTDVVQGEVHDEKAFYSMDGIAGHAGLMGPAQEMAYLGQAMYNHGFIGNVQLFDQPTMNDFVAPNPLRLDQAEGGWRVTSEDRAYFYFSPYASVGTVGHTGWTGTFTLIDPVRNISLALATNSRNAPIAIRASDSFYTGNFNTNSYVMVAELMYHAMGLAEDSVTPEQYLINLIDGEIPADVNATGPSKRNVLRAELAVLTELAPTSDVLNTYLQSEKIQGLIAELEPTEARDTNFLVVTKHLDEKIDEAEAIDTSIYTDESVAVLEEILDTAVTLLDRSDLEVDENPDFDQEDVDNLVIALQDAIDNLELRPEGEFALGVEVRGLDGRRTTEATVTVTDVDGTVVEGNFNEYSQWLTTEELVEGTYTITLVTPEGTVAEINDTVSTQAAVATDEENVFTIELNEETQGNLSTVYGAFRLVEIEETYALGVEVRGLDGRRTTEVTVRVTDVDGEVVLGEFNENGQWLTTEELAEGTYTITLVTPDGTLAEINDTVSTQAAVATDEENVFTIELNEETQGNLSTIYGAFRLIEVEIEETFALGVEVRGLDGRRTTEVTVNVTDVDGLVIVGEFNENGQWLTTEELVEGTYTITLVTPEGTVAEINDTVSTQAAVATDEENVFTIELNEETQGNLSAVYGAFRLVEVDETDPTDPTDPVDPVTEFTLGIEVRGLDGRRTTEVTVNVTNNDGEVVVGEFNENGQWLSTSEHPEGAYTIILVTPEGTVAEINDTAASQVAVATNVENVFMIDLNEENLGNLSAVYGAFRLVEVDDTVAKADLVILTVDEVFDGVADFNISTNGDLDTLEEIVVIVNGERHILTAEQYTAVSGSTVITVPAEVLNELVADVNTFTIEITQSEGVNHNAGVVSAEVAVVIEAAPEETTVPSETTTPDDETDGTTTGQPVTSTGESGRYIVIAISLLGLASALIAISIYRKKREEL